VSNPTITFPRAPGSLLNFNRYTALIHSREILNRPKIVSSEFHLHHIIPRCIGGDDDDSNLISLTLREHYIAHALLAKAFPDHSGLTKAIFFFKKFASNSRLFSTICSYKHSEETKKRIGDSNRGKSRSRKVPMGKEERMQRAKRCKDRVWTEESKEKCRQAALRNPAAIQKMLEAANSRNRHGILNSRANKEVWENESYLKSVWQSNGKCGFRRLYTLTNLGKTPQSLKSIVEKFKREDDIV
jgi:hypothetical protein